MIAADNVQGILEVFDIEVPESAIRFARWVRATLQISFHRDEQDGEDRAAKYFVKALNVMRTPGIADRGVSRSDVAFLGLSETADVAISSGGDTMVDGSSLESRYGCLHVSSAIPT